MDSVIDYIMFSKMPLQDALSEENPIIEGIVHDPIPELNNPEPKVRTSSMPKVVKRIAETHTTTQVKPYSLHS